MALLNTTQSLNYFKKSKYSLLFHLFTLEKGVRLSNLSPYFNENDVRSAIGESKKCFSCGGVRYRSMCA